MLPKRKKSHYPVPGRRESLWKKRGTTIQYLLYFAAGVLLGSIAAVLCGAESIPCRILVNQLRAIPEQGLWALWRERLLFMAILLLYLMIAARCLWEFNDSGGTGVVWNRAGNSGQLFADVGGFGRNRIYFVGDTSAKDGAVGGADFDVQLGA